MWHQRTVLWLVGVFPHLYPTGVVVMFCVVKLDKVDQERSCQLPRFLSHLSIPSPSCTCSWRGFVALILLHVPLPWLCHPRWSTSVEAPLFTLSTAW